MVAAAIRQVFLQPDHQAATLVWRQAKAVEPSNDRLRLAGNPRLLHNAARSVQTQKCETSSETSIPVQ